MALSLNALRSRSSWRRLAPNATGWPEKRRNSACAPTRTSPNGMAPAAERATLAEQLAAACAERAALSALAAAACAERDRLAGEAAEQLMRAEALLPERDALQERLGAAEAEKVRMAKAGIWTRLWGY